MERMTDDPFMRFNENLFLFCFVFFKKGSETSALGIRSTNGSIFGFIFLFAIRANGVYLYIIYLYKVGRMWYG